MLGGNTHHLYLTSFPIPPIHRYSGKLGLFGRSASKYACSQANLTSSSVKCGCRAKTRGCISSSRMDPPPQRISVWHRIILQYYTTNFNPRPPPKSSPRRARTESHTPPPRTRWLRRIRRAPRRPNASAPPPVSRRQRALKSGPSACNLRANPPARYFRSSSSSSVKPAALIASAALSASWKRSTSTAWSPRSEKQ